MAVVAAQALGGSEPIVTNAARSTKVSFSTVLHSDGLHNFSRKA